MRFSVDQVFGLAPSTVVDGLHSREFHEWRAARSPDAPVLLDASDEGGTIRSAARYRYTGPLPPGAGRFVDPQKLSWVLEVAHDRATLRGTWVVHPDHMTGTLRASGTSVLVEAGPATTARTLAGDLTVRLPLVGGRVERAIVDGLRDHAAEEAELLVAWAERPR